MDGFQISVGQTGKVFRSLINILADIFSKVVVWLPREVIQATMPAQFIEGGYTNTTVIIDCTETPLQMPERLYARGQSFSHYKGRNTVRFFIAVAPSGFVMFVSCAYGERASDKHIVDDSGFAEYLSHNDQVTADRGFSLSTEMKDKGVNEAQRPSLHKRTDTNHRKRSDRVEENFKTSNPCGTSHWNRILNQPQPIHDKKIMNKIVLVCAGLCNLKGPLLANREPQKRKMDEDHD